MNETEHLVGEAEEKFIRLVQQSDGQYKVDSNIEGWEQHIKMVAAAIRDAEVKRQLGLS